MTINKDNMELWIQALESDKHQQCTGVLKAPAQEETVVTFGNGALTTFEAQPEMHCALGIGVLVALQHGVNEYDEFGYSVWDAYTELPPRVRNFYGLESSNPTVTIDEVKTVITEHNDGNGHSFWTIAQAMRAEFLKDEG